MTPRINTSRSRTCQDSGWSGKEVRSPSPPPLRTVHAPYQRIRLKHRSTPLRGTTGHSSAGPRHPLRNAVARLAGTTWTVLRQSRLPKIGGGRTYGRCRPKQICLAPWAGWLSVPIRRHPGEVSSLSRGVTSPGGSTPIRPVTGRHSLPPPSSTRRPIGSPYGWPTLAGRRRAYHVASQQSWWIRPRLDAGGSSSAPDE